MYNEYQLYLQRDEELDRSREAKLKRELLGEFAYVDPETGLDRETGCTPQEIEAFPVRAEIGRKEAA